MLPNISKVTDLKDNRSKIILFNDIKKFKEIDIDSETLQFIEKKLEDDNLFLLTERRKITALVYVKATENIEEKARKAGNKIYEQLKSAEIEEIQIENYAKQDFTLALLEGILLSSYKFEKYKKKKSDFSLKSIKLLNSNLPQNDIDELKNIVQSVFVARDLVNEPLSYLTANQFSKELEAMGQKAGFSVDVFGKKKIEALKMGGLLAVNKGSIDPPTFNILEWKPENATNSQPIVLVGKGIVYDTGGLSLKPTSKSMDYMKSDMAGGATIASTIYAIALNKLPLHIIGLVPATDNRPDGNAYAPGDVITMFDGTTVEVKNTDAEGRLVLADALSYAKKYQPKLVIDVATLTGSAMMIAGKHAIMAMGNTENDLQQLQKSGNIVFERIIRLPLWEEFAKPLKSSIADINNLGEREGQTSIAGKFLEHFTNYNWMHLDTAGVSYIHEKNHYHPEGGTGIGVRLLYNFLKKYN